MTIPGWLEAGGCLGLAQDAPRRPGGLDHLHCHRALEPPVPASQTVPNPPAPIRSEQPESSQRRITHHDAFTLRHYPRRSCAPCVSLRATGHTFVPLAFKDEDDYSPVATEPENHGAPAARAPASAARRLGAVVAGIPNLALLVLDPGMLERA